MTSIELDSLSFEELMQHRKDVENAIRSYEARQRREALDAAEAAAREKGFSLSQLISGSVKKTSVAKFRHPEDSSLTWTGRGRQPAWFKEWIGAGRNPDDLLI